MYLSVEEEGGTADHRWRISLGVSVVIPLDSYGGREGGGEVRSDRVSSCDIYCNGLVISYSPCLLLLFLFLYPSLFLF